MSVVSTVLDEVAGVDRLVEQVRGQLRAGDELIVVDGGSTDGTPERLRELSAVDSRVRMLAAPGTNIPAGRNAGIRVAINPVIAVTDADCELAPEWLEALRRPFAEADPAGLVAGNCAVASQSTLQRAQALACYADIDETRFPTLLHRAYGRLFGGTFDPRLPFARSLAFSREAWELAGGFPEHLRWVEDGVFGRTVAEHRRCVLAADAIVTWRQRGSLPATVRMYADYGRGAAASGDRILVARDAVRLLAYVGAAVLATRGRRGALSALTGGLAYLSLPMCRVVRHRAGVATALCVPLALAAKDVGKMAGQVAERCGRARH